MELSIECLPCLVNQAVRLVKTHLDAEEEQRSLVKRIMLEIGSCEDSATAPFVAHKIQRLIKETLQNPDPYKEAKHYFNLEMLKLEDEFYDLIISADDQLTTALKLAAAGNIIDFGPGYEVSRDEVLKVINQTLDKEFDQEAFISLKDDLLSARKLLYLGDNAGEIVFDKMFIRTIKSEFPELEVEFATRGAPVLNDITEEDAYFVGMDSYARIINNGTDIPGTVLEYCSSSFNLAFGSADIIIAKGQGNFESLHGVGRNNLYYIFLCKCNLFMEKLGVLQNDIVLVKEK